MAIPFGANIELLTTLPNFTRDMFATKAEMKAFAEYKLPDIFITTCKEDGNVYVFNKNNTVDAVTGKWRPIDASGSKNYEDLTNKPSIDGHELHAGCSADELGLYDKLSVDGLLDNKVDKVDGKELNNRKLAMARLKKGSVVAVNGEKGKITGFSKRGFPIVLVSGEERKMFVDEIVNINELIEKYGKTA